MQSRGAETGGLTLREAIQFYETRGYKGQFGAREGGAILCFTCQTRNDPSTVRLDSLRRVEGASDPADMALVAALRCPKCGAWGTGTFMFGPMAAPEDNEAIRRVEDIRMCLHSGLDDEGFCRALAGPPPIHMDRAATLERDAL